MNLSDNRARYESLSPGGTRTRSRLQRLGIATMITVIIIVMARFSHAATPTLGGATPTVTYTEPSMPVQVTTAITVTDIDNAIASATVQITGFVNGEDLLTFTPAGGISGAYNPATGILTLSGTTTPGNYQSVLRSVRYSNSSHPINGSRILGFTVNDGTTSSNTANITVSLNDAPVLSAIEGIALGYTEDDPATIVTTSLVVNDVDNTTLTGATVSGATQTGDLLAATDQFGITSSFASGTLTLAGSATVAEYQIVLRSVTFRNSNLLNPPTATRNLSFRVTDGITMSAAVVRQVTVTQVNDAPVISGVAATISAYAEGTTNKAITSTSLVITDETGATGATIQITGNFSADDVLSLTGTFGSISASWDAMTATLTLSGAGSATNYRDALRNIRYTNTNNDNPSALTRTFAFTVTDGALSSTTVYSDMPFTAINDIPVVSGIDPTPLAYTEDDPATLVAGTIVVNDVDNLTLTGATVAVGTTTGDVLDFTSAFGITGSFTSGTLTLSGTATPAEYQAVLRTVTYRNTVTVNPSVTTRTLTFRVNDGAAQSAAVTRQILFTAVNDAPILSGMASTVIPYAEGGTATAVAGGLIITDLDNTTIASAEVAVTTNYVSTEDVLAYTTAAGITASFDAAAGIITFTGPASNANFQATLRSVTYRNSNTILPSPLARTVSYTINDGGLNSNTVSRTITVAPKETITTTEEVAIDIAVQAYSASVNSSIDLSSIVLTSPLANGSAAVDNSTGIITYTPNAQFNTGGTAVADVVKFTMKDNNGVLSGVVSYTVNVTLVNDAPVFTKGADITVAEDAGSLTFTGWATGINDSEPYNTQTLTFVVTTDNDALFQNKPSISASTGNLAFRSAANKSGIANVTVTLTDNGSNVLPNINYSASQLFVIKVLSVNDAPVAYDDTYSTSSIAPLSASVRTTDTENNVVKLSNVPVIAPSHGSVVLQPSGTFTYTPDPSYTGPDSFRFQVCDDGTDDGVLASRCAEATINITVNPVNNDWNIVGNNSIQLAPNSFILTQDLTNQQGAIWNKHPLDLRYSFDLNLNAIFSAEGVVKDTAGADGMVFVFQRDFTPPPLDVPDLPIYARGVYGGNLGVGNISPSFHVEVDTWMNYNVSDPDPAKHQLDPWYDHISIGKNGFVWDYIGNVVPAVLDGTNHAVNIEDGQWHAIRILWDNPAKTLKVEFDGVQKIVVTNDIASLVFGNDPSNVYWGFTASTGGKSNYQALKDIVMTVTNLPPTVGADAVSVDEDAVLNGTSLLANDEDPEGTSITILAETKTTAHGEVVIHADGTFTYTPVHNYFGSDSFTYQVCDSYSTVACSTGTVNITVNPMQDPPVATDDVFSTPEDTKLEVTCNCVFINDYDPDGEPLLGGVIETVKHGTFVIQPNGSFEYMPEQDFFGTDSFVYYVTDGIDTVSGAVVTINVIPVNDPPVAVNDLAEALEDVPSILPILANDKDVDDVISTSMITIVTPPQHGTLQITANDVVYTSTQDYYGPDSFTYTLKDPAGAVSNLATVTIAVKPVNDVPVTTADAANTPEDTPVIIDVLSNDTDVDNALVPSSVKVTTPSHGTLKVNPDGTLEYSPSKDYFGPDSFTYTVKDTEGGESQPALVSITVTPVNDAPVAVDDQAETLQNTSVDIHILDNDSDVDNTVDASSIVVSSQPSHGTVNILPDGTAHYVPQTDYLGNDEFSYTIQDAAGLVSLPAKVTVAVVPPNQPPVAIDDGPINHRFLLDLVVDVLANDYDVDNDHSELIIQSVTQPNAGSVSIEGNHVVYHPAGIQSGVVTFTYTIADPAGLTATATVTIEYVYNPLTVSEGFSPNNDNANDTWYILSIENFPNNQVKVFDRWGLMVYQRNNYENTVAPWDGRANVGQQAGKLLDQGTYYYMLDVGSEIKVLTGFVMITR